MKKLIVLSAIISGTLLCRPATAQISLGLSINIGSQPAWGPSGYDYAEYYYLPDIDAYYYVPEHQFIYLDAGRWIFAASLPPRWRGYDLYRGYKVVINEPRPYLRNDYYNRTYVRYRGNYGRQAVIRDRDARYARTSYPAGRDFRPAAQSAPVRYSQDRDHNNEPRYRNDQGHNNRNDHGHDNRRDDRHGRR